MLHKDEHDGSMCSVNFVHKDLVDTLYEKIIPLEKANDLSNLFKTLGDPTRIRIMDALAKSELCVCDIAELLNISQSAVSHQLRVLRSNHLVKFRREGKMVYYSLDDDHVMALYGQGLEHISEHHS